MYDELVKALRETDFGDTCVLCEHEDMCKGNDCIIIQAADAIEKLLSRLQNAINWTSVEKGCKDLCAYLPKWIPVTERLPEEYVNVLCHLRSLDRQSEYYSIDHLMEDGQWWKAANSWKHEVTHWMPLPEPPKEET